MTTLKDRLDTLLGSDRSLTTWEIDFLESLQNQEFALIPPTAKQLDKLEEIEERICR